MYIRFIALILTTLAFAGCDNTEANTGPSISGSSEIRAQVDDSGTAPFSKDIAVVFNISDDGRVVDDNDNILNGKLAITVVYLSNVGNVDTSELEYEIEETEYGTGDTGIPVQPELPSGRTPTHYLLTVSGTVTVGGASTTDKSFIIRVFASDGDKTVSFDTLVTVQYTSVS